MVTKMIRHSNTSSFDVDTLPSEILLALVLSSERVHYYSHQHSRKMLSCFDNRLTNLYEATREEIQQTTSMSNYEVLRLKASQELILRRQAEEVLMKPKISRSDDVYRLFHHLQGQVYEEFWIVVLSRANRVLDQIKISEGGLSGTVVDIRRILRSVILGLGTSMILVHNHPSGSLTPSPQDIEITKRINESAKLMDIEVLDHVIVAGTGYYSFADNGLV